MSIPIFDCCLLIHDSTESGEYSRDMDDFLLEKLDAMLNEYNLRHAFTLPYFQGSDPDPDTCAMRLYYEEKDEMAVELVFCLFSTLYRGVPRDRVLRCFAKKAKRQGITIAE